MSMEMQRLLTKDNQISLGPNELKSFAVPLPTLRIYANALRELGPKLQDILLLALGIEPTDHDVTCSWDQFVRLNCVTFLQVSRFEEKVEFYVSVLDP